MFKQCKDVILLSASQPLKKNIGGHKVLFTISVSPIRNNDKTLFPLSCNLILVWNQYDTIYLTLQGLITALMQCYNKEPRQGILSFR